MICGTAESCCACGACIHACPAKAISFFEDEAANAFAKIDASKCIECNKCSSVCPVLTNIDFTFPRNVYVAWSTNKTQQLASSSGGFAAEAMKYGIAHGISVFATVWARCDGGGYVSEIKTEEDIAHAVGSKYVQSNLFSALDRMEKVLRAGEKILFIGLPCQNAAVSKLFSVYRSRLVLVELICHGVPPQKYLEQHLEYIEKKKKKETRLVTFRNSPGKPGEYRLACYDRLIGTPFYDEAMHSGKDVYYLGFRDNYIFRKHCYSCRFAREERASDITIGDYSGLGALWEYNGSERKVNCVLVMTETGKEFMNTLLLAGRIAVIARPLAEPYSAKGNPQLRAPNKETPLRFAFLKKYITYKDFDRAANSAFCFVIIKTKIAWFFISIKSAVLRAIPKNVKQYIKRKIFY